MDFENITTFDAKTHLSSLLEKVRSGQEFLITKRGKPVAKLSPCSSESKQSRSELIKEMLQFRSEHMLGADIKIQDLKLEGRR